jgi:signal transduction histidine kinase
VCGLIRIIAISYRHWDAERPFQSTNGTILDGGAEKSRNNPYETDDGKQRCFDVRITALGPEDDPVGQAVVINDVTDREIRKEKLERQNERLDQFAAVVSHDLRNPLNVAKGYLQTAKSVEENREFVEEAEHSLDRMEAIIEDVLTLAREGNSIGDTEAVTLETVVRETWDNVDTGNAQLAVELDHRIEADPDRLPNLFENLFRNAIEHGSTDDRTPDESVDAAGVGTTVTVGWEDDGFYVADDGPGIPESEREEVLEYGYTTTETGTGFGLAIVEQVADTHDWDVTVAESESGGAKFVFARVTQPGSPLRE